MIIIYFTKKLCLVMRGRLLPQTLLLALENFTRSKLRYDSKIENFEKIKNFKKSHLVME